MKANKSAPEAVRLIKLANATLGSANLKLAVTLPEGEDLNEWLAVNTVDFFNQINLLYGTVSGFCTKQSCPIMNAGPKWEFLWCDGVEYKRPTKLCAPDYTQKLMSWIRCQIEDEVLFPTTMGVGFSKKFPIAVKNIFKRLSRVYAHLYHCHFQVFIDAGVDTLLNTSFKHFKYFAEAFELLVGKDLGPLEVLILN